MLGCILGITKRGKKGTAVEARGITNRGSLRDFKSAQKDCKFGQGFQIGSKRFQIGAEITNRGKRDYKQGQGFQIGAGITNRCRIVLKNRLFIKNVRNSVIRLSAFFKAPVS